MRLTPELLSAGYDFLRQAEPFDGWNLPEPEDVKFQVSANTADYGATWRDDGERVVICLSSRMHARHVAVLATLAHEMIHVHLRQVGGKTKRGWHRHGKTWRAFAKQVLDRFPEFDPITFCDG